MKHKSKNEINDGHYLELMDRLYVHTASIDDYLYKHPLTKRLKKVEKLISTAGMCLAEAYQLVGEHSYKSNQTKNGIQKVIFRRHKNTKN
jgi:hypothetical protein